MGTPKAWKKWITVLVMTAIVMIAAGAAAEIRDQLVKESTIEKVLRKGVLRVGMSTFVPWAMKDKTGELIGFEIDVATRLAKDTGVEVEFVPTKWAGIIPALLTGKFDVIIGGMGILPKRNLKVNFTIPYDYSGMSIVAHKQKASGFRHLEEFNKAGVVVTARLGSTAELAARKHLPNAELRLFDDESQVIQEVLSGRVHALVASAPLPAFLAVENANRLFLPLEETFTKEPIGFAVRKGDVDTLNYFNNWIRVVESEGWFKERKSYWFGTKDWENRIK
ncbi:MAG TPA: transporter substrate-binding domain-containing protein [Desulfobacterales bacterium]